MDNIGGYKVIEKINAGGMATVYKGFQVSLSRPVAIKLLFKKLSEDPDIVERFDRESIIIARLTHPNIIHVIDRGITSDGMPYFVMDLVKGADLAELIKEAAYTFNQKLNVIIQVCKALSYAHKNGVIHRDIKPANILIDSEENVLVSDFGIAQFLNEETGGDGLTREGVVMGTPTYMSPEQQTSSKDVSPSSDIFSLGVVMYELFTGTKPLGLFKPPSQINPDIPSDLEDVILKCLEPDPSNRTTPADEIKDRLLGLLQGAHIRDTQKKKAVQGIKKMEDVFDLLDIIKEHEFGAIYHFKHKISGQSMVVKKYKGSLGGLKEAELLSTLKHKNIADIYGVSKNELLFIVVMEYVTGGSLKDRMIRPHSWMDVLKTARQICEALSFVHKNRIIHGNLRPSNILISASGDVKITDFGLSEHYAFDESKTNWYNIYGKPRSHKTDIFAAGVIFYEMLTGLIPVWGEDGFVPHRQFDSLPVDLQTMISNMISHEPKNRYSSFDEVLVVIDDILKACKSESTLIMATEESAVKKEKMKGLKRPLRTLLLLAILIATAAAYVFFTGQTKFYLDAILQLLKIKG